MPNLAPCVACSGGFASLVLVGVVPTVRPAAMHTVFCEICEKEIRNEAWWLGETMVCYWCYETFSPRPRVSSRIWSFLRWLLGAKGS
jgi:uncharacterized CHY-type Zn-finger protein